jgi:hypothetical protein
VPYLLVTSAEKSSGKSTVGEILSHTVPADRILGESMSAALLGRTCGGKTVIYDEIDGVYTGRASDGEGDAVEKRSILNGGFKKTGQYHRLVATKGNDYVPMSWPTFGPKVLIGLGSNVPDTVQSRSIGIRMERQDREASGLMPFHEFIHEEELSIFRRQIGDVTKYLGRLDMLDVFSLPKSMDDRQKDIWLPLFTLADLAGPAWYQRAVNAGVRLSAAAQPVSLGIRLLQDIYRIFEEKGMPALIPTADLIGRPEDPDPKWGKDASGLCAIESSQWAVFSGGRAPIAPQRVAAILSEYRVSKDGDPIAPKRKSSGASGGYTKTGYWAEDLRYAWEAYADLGGESSGDPSEGEETG